MKSSNSTVLESLTRLQELAPKLHQVRDKVKDDFRKVENFLNEAKWTSKVQTGEFDKVLAFQKFGQDKRFRLIQVEYGPTFLDSGGFVHAQPVELTSWENLDTADLFDRAREIPELLREVARVADRSIKLLDEVTPIIEQFDRAFAEIRSPDRKK